MLDRMTNTPITVIGGTGKTGRRVVAQLRRAGHEPRAASRSAATRFDWTDRDTWPAAVEGAGAVYVTPYDPGDGDLLKAFTDVAVHAGVRRLVLLSAREWVDIHDTAALAREDAVRDCGADWTILRPTWFAQNFSEEPFFSDGVRAGELAHGTGDGRHPFVDVEDIAAVAVAALTGEGHGGRTYDLSGPRALTVAEALAEISTAADRPIRPVPLPLQAYREHLTGLGYPQEAAAGVAGLSALIRDGDDAYVSDGVWRALGRPARDFADYVAATDWTG
ncbi:NAD(P)H-binding protein [Polymorphospora rubra]|uniref:NmrA family protein n=2 Tax=Polymorphospora rubra TaxID=338584 RepID=A0A810N5Y8_9ACTN|nr:NmrA family protein [Polymorphospora rubra]